MGGSAAGRSTADTGFGGLPAVRRTVTVTLPGATPARRSTSPGPGRSPGAELAGLPEMQRHVAHLGVGLHRDPRERLECLVGGQLEPFHEDALGLVDDGP